MSNSRYSSIVITFLSFLFTMHLTGEGSFAQQLERRVLSQETIFPIATIVEAFLATTSYNDAAAFLLKKNNSDSKNNNDIRQKLAEKWIHNAAANVFCDDFRSFLEIVVNACDASTDLQNCVGKFGMGFFSLLELLHYEKTGGTIIEIDTTYQDGGQLIRYGMRFFKDEKKHLYVKFMPKNIEENSSTGTTVSIKPINNDFSEDVILDLIKSVGMMRYYKHVPINLFVHYQKKYSHEIVNPSVPTKDANNVTVVLRPKKILVTDHGTGIPLQVAFTKLLVPSSSSKTQQKILPLSSIPINRPEIVLQTSIAADSSSHFLITTNGIVVVDKKIPTQLFNEDGALCDLVVALPQATQLALARNELLIASDGSSQEEKHLRQIIRSVVLTAIYGSKKNRATLEAFYEGLLLWEHESGAQHLHGRFTSFLQRELDQALDDNKQMFPVPTAMTQAFFESIAPDSSIQIFQIKPDLVAHNYEKFETFLIHYYLENLSYFFSSYYTLKQEGILGRLILGKNIIFVPDHFIKEPTTLNLRRILFVPESFLAKSRTKIEVSNRILSALPLQKLQPHASGKVRKNYLFYDAQKGTDFEVSQQESLWIDNIARPLFSIAPGLQYYLRHCISGFNVFVNQCMDSQELSMETKELVKKLKQSLWGRTNTYYSISTADLPSIYCPREQFLIDVSNNGTFSPVWAKAMKALLESLEQNQPTKKIIPRIIDFQTRDFIQKTDLVERNKTLGTLRLHAPDMCLGTPLGLLGALASIEKFSEQALSLIAATIEEVRSLEELVFISLSLFTMPKENLHDLCSPKGTAAIRCAIKQYIQKKINPRLLRKFYNTTSIIDFGSSRAIDHATNDDQQLCKGFQSLLVSLLNQTISFPEITSVLPPSLKHSTQTTASVFLSQLIGAHCSNAGLQDLLEKEQLEKALELVSKIPLRTLEKIGINAECGSERSSFEATAIECIQNSIDATKNLYHHNPALKNNARARIDLELGWTRTNNQKSALVFTIQDYVGFKNGKELLTEFILPDLSSKSSEKKLVGQMGNGSFYMYKNAEVVHVLTKTISNASRCYLLTIKPVRNAQTGILYDLQLSWNDVTESIKKYDPDFCGTSVTIQFLPSPHDEGTQFNLVEAAHFLRNSLGNCNIRLNNKAKSPVIITLNQLDQLNDPIHSKVLYRCSSGCRLFKNANPLQQSYVTTGGIPFRPLVSVIREMKLLPENFCDDLEQGYSIDLPPDFYTPVQSRTHLRINEENQQILSELCFELFFIAGVYQGISEVIEKKPRKKFLSKHFSQFLSEESAWSVMPNASDNGAFQKSLQDWIKNKKVSPVLSPELFFDFYKPRSFAENSFSNFYDVITDICEKMCTTYFDSHEEVVDTYFKDHEIFLEKTLSAEHCEQHPEATLSHIKNHFEKILDEIEQECNASIYETLVNLVSDEFNNIKINGDKRSQTLSKNFIECILREWINPKMRKANFLFNRSIAYSLLLDNNKISSIKSKIGKSKQIDIINKQKQNTPTPVSPAHLKTLADAWTIFCREFFTAIGLPHNDIECRPSPNLPANCGGQYLEESHEIEINLSKVDVFEQIQLFRALERYNPRKTSFECITELIGFKNLYAPIIGKAPTILHELEHARREILRKIFHGKSKTDPIESFLYGLGDHTHSCDAQGNFVSFDACANSWGAYAIKQGLIQAWAEQVGQLKR